MIPEPLKARSTKGEALPYYASMPLQKDAWRTLVEKEEFSLIGQPLSEEHLISIDQGTRQLLDAVGLHDVTFHLWVSGDYSAATDGLSLAISQIAMEEYLKSRVGLLTMMAMICGKLPKCLEHTSSAMERRMSP